LIPIENSSVIGIYVGEVYKIWWCICYTIKNPNFIFTNTSPFLSFFFL